jgi:POT family proton-dependent oligopeptide transporter
VPYAAPIPAPLRVGEEGHLEVVRKAKKLGEEDTVVRFDGGRLQVMRGGLPVGPGTQEGSFAGQELVVHGVLPKYVVNDLLAYVASPEVKRDVFGDDEAKVEGLEAKTKGATKDAPYVWKVPSDTFRYPFEGKDPKDTKMQWSADDRTVAFFAPVSKPALAELVAGAAEPALRDAVWSLEEKSGAARSSAIWLFLSYLLATLGELCLSPVGLSMVTKLAPQRFASLFMGVWLLASSLAQYVGGSIGESWGSVPPIPYFQIFVWTSVVGCVLLGLLTFPIKKLMHEVH